MDSTNLCDMAHNNDYSVVSSVLEDLNLGPLLHRFIENCIDDDLFLNMTPDMIEKVLPATVYGYGPQWKLERKLNSLRATSKIVPDGDNIEIITFDSPLESTAPMTVSDETQCGPSGLNKRPQSNDNISTHEVDDPDDPDWSPPSPKRKSNTPSPEAKATDNPAANLKQVNPAATSKQVDVDKFLQEKMSADKFQQELRNMDFEELLKTSVEGLAALNSYKLSGVLEKDDQTNISDIAAKWIVWRITRQPTREELIIMKDKMLAVFPNEENVYYIPSKSTLCQKDKNSGPEVQRLARGKLYDRVRNLREWMKTKKLIPANEKKSSAKASGTIALSLDAVELTEAVKNDMEWLQNFREPWGRVKEKWAATSKYRMYDLAKSDGSVADYTNKFKQLQLKNGHELIEIDFSTKHPGKEDILSKNWKDFRNKITKILEPRKAVKDEEGKAIRDSLADCTDDTQDLFILQLLPSLLPPSRFVKIGAKRLKPSIKECRNAFVATVKVRNQVNPLMAERRKFVAAYGKGATVQPYLIVVCPDGKTLDGVYVCIDLFVYRLSSVLEGLDVCFKSFFALNSEYPVEAQDIWLLIQKVLYEISSPDPNTLSVKSFMKRLQFTEVEEMF